MVAIDQLAPYWARLDDTDRKHLVLLAARFAEDRPEAKPGPDDGGGWMTIPEVAEWTGLSRSGIEHAIERGALTAVMPKGLKKGRRIRRDDVLAWMGGK